MSGKIGFYHLTVMLDLLGLALFALISQRDMGFVQAAAFTLVILYGIVGAIMVPIAQEASFYKFLKVFLTTEMVYKRGAELANEVKEILDLERMVQGKGREVGKAALAHKKDAVARFVALAEQVNVYTDYHLSSRYQDYPTDTE